MALLSRITCITFCLILFSYVSMAQKTTSSVQTGTWNNAATWDNGAPGNNDTVVINYGHIVTLGGNTTVARLIINSGAL